MPCVIYLQGECKKARQFLYFLTSMLPVLIWSSRFEAFVACCGRWGHFEKGESKDIFQKEMDYRTCKLAVNLLKNMLCHYSGKVSGRSFLLEMQTHVIIIYAAATGLSFSPFIYLKCKNFFFSAYETYASFWLKQLSNYIQSLIQLPQLLQHSLPSSSGVCSEWCPSAYWFSWFWTGEAFTFAPETVLLIAFNCRQIIVKRQQILDSW